MPPLPCRRIVRRQNRCAVFLFFSLFLTAADPHVFAEESAVSNDTWILAASALKTTQYGEAAADSAAEHIASLIPSLIIEYLAADSVRTLGDDEIIARRTYELHEKWNALFSSMTKQIQSRDALLFSRNSASELSEKQKESEKKIAELENDINGSFEQEANLIPEYEAEKKSPRHTLLPEKITLWKNDSSSLFSVSGGIEEGSVAFQKAVVREKIRGLIGGTLEVYGNFISVTISITEYPGNTVLKTVTDAGTMANAESIAKNLASRLAETLYNAPPVCIHVQIEPADADAATNVGGQVFRGCEAAAEIQSGIHTLRIGAPGFKTVSFSYDFSGSRDFFVSVRLRPELQMPAFIRSTDGTVGALYLNSLYLGSVPAEIVINNSRYIGEIVTENGAATYFLLNPPQETSEALLYSVRPFQEDISELIERSRRKLYTSYGAVLISLPFLFYSLGQYESKVNARRTGTSIPLEDIDSAKTAIVISGCVTAACLSFMVYRLFRYVQAAGKVLPQKAALSAGKNRSGNVPPDLSAEAYSDAEMIREEKYE
ncbi:MAG: hypothetical protein NC176_02810 [Treponema brennaborense]|nr:hypothetical protein [Prevotella sp.]MCM1407399.1 hypothetical protein [Treponema brennaborense]